MISCHLKDRGESPSTDSIAMRRRCHCTLSSFLPGAGGGCCVPWECGFGRAQERRQP